MKVLLINPYCLDQRIQDYDIKIVPIGLYYIGAVLIEQGHDVRILNWYNASQQKKMIEETFSKEQPDIIGLSIMHASRWGGIDIARIAKRILPECHIIFGGPGATFLWKHLLTNFQEIDYVITNEGELTFPEIINVINSTHLDGLEQHLSAIKGIAFRFQGKPVKNPDRDFISDIDSLPDPAKYFTFEHVISSRGCPWNCTFCGSPAFWKRKVRFHSPDYFVTQLERLNRKGIRFFYVSDDTFTLKSDRVIEICKEIIKRRIDITWFAISRVNHINKDILYWMRRAGCIQISFGVESGDLKIRKIFNKQISDDEIKNAFDLTTSYGIMPRAYFIYGAPGENKKTITRTIRLIEQIKPLSAIFYILDLFPGTALYDDFIKRTGKTDQIWLKRIEDIMYFETDHRLNKKDILKFGEKLRRNFNKKLPEFALSVSLVDIPELHIHHADFLARLGMTFIMGDYASITEIKNHDHVAEELFQRALEWAPCERAFLGLGVIMQQRGNYMESIKLLQQGQQHFPDSPDINICLAISLANSGYIDHAIEIFTSYPDRPDAMQHALNCARATGNFDLEKRITEQLQTLEHKR
jgi:radical SAM superfamily enzyme YgiQ (UPF0313 family)